MDLTDKALPYPFITVEEVKRVAPKFNKKLEDITDENIQKFNSILNSIYYINDKVHDRERGTKITNEDTIIRILGDVVHDIGPHAYTTNIAGYLEKQIGASNINIDTFFTEPGKNPMENNIKKFLNEYLIKYDNAEFTDDYISTFEYKGTTLEFKNTLQNAGCDYIILDAQFGNPVMKYFSKLESSDIPFTYIDSTVGFADGASKLSYDTIIENNNMKYMPDYNSFIVHNFFKNRRHEFYTEVEQKGKKTVVTSGISVYDGLQTPPSNFFNVGVTGGFSVNSICKLTHNVKCRGDSDAKNPVSLSSKMRVDEDMRKEILLIKTITDYSQVYYAAFLWHILGIKTMFVTNDAYCLPLTRLFKLPFVLFTKKHDQIAYIFDENAVTLSETDIKDIQDKSMSLTDTVKDEIYEKFNSLVNVIKIYTLKASKISKFLSGLITLTKLNSIKSIIDERIENINKIKSGDFNNSDIKLVLTLKNSETVDRYVFDYDLQFTFINQFLKSTANSIESKCIININKFKGDEFYNNIYKFFESIDISYINRIFQTNLDPIIITEIIIAKIFAIHYNTYILLDQFKEGFEDSVFNQNYPQIDDRNRFHINIAKYSSVLFILNGIISRTFKDYINKQFNKLPLLNTILTNTIDSIPIMSILNNKYYNFDFEIQNIINVQTLHKYYNDSLTAFTNMRGQSKESVDQVVNIFDTYFIHHTVEGDVFHDHIYLDFIKVAYLQLQVDEDQVTKLNKMLSYIFEIFQLYYPIAPTASTAPIAPTAITAPITSISGKKRERDNSLSLNSPIEPVKKKKVVHKGGIYNSDYNPFIAYYYMKPFNMIQYSKYKVNILRNKEDVLYKSSISSYEIDTIINEILSIKLNIKIQNDEIYTTCKQFIKILEILHDDASESGEGDEYINTIQMLKEIYDSYNHDDGLELHVIIQQLFAYIFDRDTIINKYFFNLLHPKLDIIPLLQVLNTMKIMSINNYQLANKKNIVMKSGLNIPSSLEPIYMKPTISVTSGGTKKKKRWSKTRKLNRNTKHSKKVRKIYKRRKTIRN